jgi:sulfite exporter TauE/SafE
MSLISGLLLGLSTGIFCTSYCAPVLIPQLTAVSDRHKGWGVFLKFSLGRLVAYAFFGALFGWLGTAAHATFLNAAGRWVMVVLSVFLILYGLGLTLPRLRWCAWTAKIRLPFVSGFLLGINICPPFLIAVTQSFSKGGILFGIIYFLMFFLGTTVHLIPFVFLGFLANRKWMQMAGRVAAIVVGTILLGQYLF